MDCVTSANPLLDLTSLIEDLLHLQDDPGFLDEGVSPAAFSPGSKQQPPLVPLQNEAEKAETSSPTTGRKARRNVLASAARARRRKSSRLPNEPPYQARPKKREELCKEAVLKCGFDPQKRRARGPVSSLTGQGPDIHRHYTLDEMVGPGSEWGFEKQEWDGSKPMVILDNHNRIIGILAGHPDDPTWPSLMEEAAEALESRRPRCYVSKEDEMILARRGDFVALRCGVSHGGGQLQPSNLHNHPQNLQILEELNSLSPFKRLAGFASSVIATWMPGLYDHYRENIDALHRQHSHLHRVFPSGIFSGYSYNLGPKTVCAVHKDKGNKATGVCSVTPVGPFDYKKGGHLILWDLCKVIEFPSGSTIIFPSAIIAHSNVAIGENERRYSFAQYSASGLFRWVESGFRTRRDYLESLSPEELDADKKVEKNRLAFGLSLLPVLSDK